MVGVLLSFVVIYLFNVFFYFLVLEFVICLYILGRFVSVNWFEVYVWKFL